MTRTNRNTIYIGFLCILSLTLAGPAAAEFRNQLHTFGGEDADIINHAKQMGYEWISGQPWSKTRAVNGKIAGLKVMFNSTAGDEAKWLRFNNPGCTVEPCSPTTSPAYYDRPTLVNGQPITAQMYQDFKKMFLMRDASAPDTDLKRKYWMATQYEKKSLLLFLNNYRCDDGIDLMVQYNRWLYDLHGGPGVYDGLFLDQVNSKPVGVNDSKTGVNPCLNDYPTHVAGQLVYIRRMRDYFKNTLGGLGASGNPWKISSYSSEGRHTAVPLDLYYNEHGGLDSNAVSTWGNIPPDRGAVQFPGSLNGDYMTGLKIAGPAAVAGAWFGYYGGGGPLSGGTNNATQLFRALPNWDNLANATGRAWDAANFRYNSSNSYADSNIVYGRQWKDGRLFVVWNTRTGRVTLRTGETISSVKCVDDIFVNLPEPNNCASHIIKTGNQISLSGTGVLGDGYVITLGGTPAPPVSPAKPRGLRFQ